MNRHAPAEPRVNGITRIWPLSVRPFTSGRSPTMQPLRMSTSPRNESAGVTSTGPEASPSTIPRARISAIDAAPWLKPSADRRLDGLCCAGQERLALDHVANVLRLLGGVHEDRSHGRRLDAERRVRRGRHRKV